MNRSNAFLVLVGMVFLFLSGCFSFHASVETACPEAVPDGSPASLIADASMERIVDSGSTADVSSFVTDVIFADQSSPQNDGAPSDGGLTSVPSSDAVILSSSLCSDRNTHLSPSLFRPGFSVWQMCYTTVGSHQADAGELLGRPASVMFTRRLDGADEPMELIRFPSPTRADPWTASVAVSIPDPPTGYPLFNVRNDYPDGRTSWAVDRNADGSALVTRGTFRLWRVYADGRKASYVPRVISNQCADLVAPDPTLSGSFFPTGSLCPAALLECSPSQYSCFGVY